ncbi:Hypothetical Protein PANA_2487 [Pantoea ananatis LMG 20103]|uniref:Uncharacterized protein n=1 Tax=Pantoea ananatis (strain LMG 20103) TaxID=706191 RepID=D4GIC0_PANAM|nr:hypothetical protein [Pantoea ananatis]ADD77654.1 Hypothetical Protein PANA_2487 [Pantoea ananatis LMG 20103]
MNKEKIISANKDILDEIEIARCDRNQKEKNGINALPKELRFLYKTTTFEINELMILCKDDYRKNLTLLIAKVTPENIKFYKVIDRFKKRPFVFVNLLAIHPQCKVKVKGRLKYTISRLLRNHKTLFDFARKIYIRIK